MSSDGRYHRRGCRVSRKKGHTSGKWCWSEEDVESLEKQYGEHKTWNQIADSFKFYDAEGNRTCYRHHSIACQAKMNALLLDAVGQATSRKLADLAKRSTPRKKPAAADDDDDHDGNNNNTLENQETADVNQEQADQDAKDDAEAEQAIKEAIIKLEPLSD